MQRLYFYRIQQSKRSYRLRGLQKVEEPRFREKPVRLSTLRTGRLNPPANTPGAYFCQRLSRPHEHIAAGRIMSVPLSGTKPSNFWLVEQCLDLLLQRVPSLDAYTRHSMFTARYELDLYIKEIMFCL